MACDSKNSNSSTSASKENRDKELCIENVKKSLKDPFSAQFEGIELGRSPTCSGMVNAKNAMGGYVGFKKFKVFEDSSVYYP